MTQPRISELATQYATEIHKSLYPRWNYTGGYIFAKVSDDGQQVILQGYQDPDRYEEDVLIRKVETSLSFKPKIYWQRIGESTPILLGQPKVEQDQAASSSSRSESGKNEQKSDLWKMVSKAHEEVKAKAAQDIQALVRLAEDTNRAVENKAAQDIQALVTFAEDSKRQAAQNIQPVTRSLEETKRQACQLLDQATQGAGQVVASLEKTVIESWNQYWVDLLLDAITNSVDLNKAKAKGAVRKLQLDYPDEQPSQIADRLIREKALYATATGLISAIPVVDLAVDSLDTTPSPVEMVYQIATATGLISPIPVVDLAVDLVDLLDATPSLVEMVYQIAVIYEFDNLKEPARKGELLAIFGIALGSGKLVQLGLGFLLKDTPIPSWAIDASTNALLFHVVGYAACQFYEVKVKERLNPLTSIDASTAIEEKVEAYLEEAISEKKTIDEVVVQSVSIKEELALA